MSPKISNIPTVKTPQAVTETERQRRLMAAKRARERDIAIPPIANPRRRRRCSKHPQRWLRTYMPHIFKHPFTADQSEMVDEVIDRIRYGGKKAHAAARGDGKTSIVKGCTAYAIAEGLLKFPLIIAINQSAADRLLLGIKKQFERKGPLSADYPEICTPIQALGGAPSRAGGMTVNGDNVEMSWSGDFLVFPTVPGSKASGTILAARGIESPFRGFEYEGQRPDMVIIDDPEDRRSARSPIEIRRGIETIDRDIGPLGGQDYEISIIYLCTIITAECIAATYTDRKKRPAWIGVRKKFLITPPDDLDPESKTKTGLWEKYFRLRIEDQLAGDTTGLNAHRFYMANRRRMDAGSKVSNPHRYNKRERPGGGTVEISALQMAMNIVCDEDWTSFNAEYQNIPPTDDLAEIDALDAAAVMRRLSGRDRGLCPPDTEQLVAAIDVHGRHIDSTVVAFRRAAGEIIDYQVDPVHSPLTGKLADAENTEKVDDAIIAALCEWRDRADGGWPIDRRSVDAPPPEDEPEPRRGLDIVFIDAAWRPDPVFAFIAAQNAVGDYRFRAIKGFGSGAGQASYRHPAKSGAGKKVYKGSTHVHAVRQPKRGAWLYHVDDDFYKGEAQDGFRVPVGRPGSLVLFGDDPVIHRNFGRQIVAEKRRRMFIAGKGYKNDWEVIDRENHKLDVTKMSIAAAVVAGMVPIRDPSPAKPIDPAAPGPKIITTRTIHKNKTPRRGRRIGQRTAAR